MFTFDDAFNKIGGNRLNVGPVGQLGVGHDGRRITIDKNDAVAFFAKDFAGLRTGVIEFTRLPDHNRARADDEDRMKVSAFGHSL